MINFIAKTRVNTRLHLINPDSNIEQNLKDMRDKDRYPFAIRNEADIVTIDNIDIRSTREGTHIVVNLKGTGDSSNSVFSEMSIGRGMGKTLTSDDIAMLRIRRILFGENDLPSGYGDSPYQCQSIYSFPDKSGLSRH